MVGLVVTIIKTGKLYVPTLAKITNVKFTPSNGPNDLNSGSSRSNSMSTNRPYFDLPDKQRTLFAMICRNCSPESRDQIEEVQIEKHKDFREENANEVEN